MANGIDEKKSWMAIINQVIQDMRPKMPTYVESFENFEESSPRRTEGSLRKQMEQAKQSILWLKEGQGDKFWKIWLQSVPYVDDLTDSRIPIEYYIVTSTRIDQICWKITFPQKSFIQQMVDFFFSAGAPESEIEILNMMGFNVRPFKIGSWVEMSNKGGLDGGWNFPVVTSFEVALKAFESGKSQELLVEWATKSVITEVFSIGRDMASTPPRQTEMKVLIPGKDCSEKTDKIIEAFAMFGFPEIPGEVKQVMTELKPNEIGLSITATLANFVKLGILIPNVNDEIIEKLLYIGEGDRDKIKQFEGVLGGRKPAYVEYRYLNTTFGYGVYKEGAEIMLHYHLGDEYSTK